MALLEKHNPQNTSEISQSSAEIAGVLVAVRDAQGNLVTTFLENVTEISGTTKKGEVTLNTETGAYTIKEKGGKITTGILDPAEITYSQPTAPSNDVSIGGGEVGLMLAGAFGFAFVQRLFGKAKPTPKPEEIEKALVEKLRKKDELGNVVSAADRNISKIEFGEKTKIKTIEQTKGILEEAVRLSEKKEDILAAKKKLQEFNKKYFPKKKEKKKSWIPKIF